MTITKITVTGRIKPPNLACGSPKVYSLILEGGPREIF